MEHKSSRCPAQIRIVAKYFSTIPYANAMLRNTRTYTLGWRSLICFDITEKIVNAGFMNSFQYVEWLKRNLVTALLNVLNSKDIHIMTRWTWYGSATLAKFAANSRHNERLFLPLKNYVSAATNSIVPSTLVAWQDFERPSVLGSRPSAHQCTEEHHHLLRHFWKQYLLEKVTGNK